MAAPVISATTFTAQNITTLLEVKSYTTTAAGWYQVQFFLSSLANSAANFDVFLRRYATGPGALLAEVGQAAVAKQTAASTTWGSGFVPIFCNSGDILTLAVKSSNAGDTAIAGTLEVWDGSDANVRMVGGTVQTSRDLGLALPAVAPGGKGGLPITDATNGTALVGYGGAGVSVAKSAATLAPGDCSGNLPAIVKAYDTGKTPLQATDFPLPAVDTYGLGCPYGVVVSGPAWGGIFDRAARIAGRPAFYRRGLLDGIQYMFNWDGADSWEAGFLPIGDTEYWLTDPSPLGEWSKPDDVVVNAPGGFSVYEGSGGYFDNYATLDVTVYAYKMVGGRTIISEVSSASVQFMDSGKAAYCSWSAVDGADGYVLHAVCPNTLNYFFDLAGTSQQVNGNEGANSEPTSDGLSPLVYPAMVVTPITAPADVQTIKGVDADTAITARVDASTATAKDATVSKPGTAQTITANQAVNVAQWGGATLPTIPGAAPTASVIAGAVLDEAKGTHTGWIAGLATPDDLPAEPDNANIGVAAAQATAAATRTAGLPELIQGAEGLKQFTAKALELGPAANSPGTGEKLVHFLIESSAGQPLIGVTCRVYLDQTKLQQVPGTGAVLSDSLGVAAFYLDAGDYWLNRSLSGMTFSPDPIAVTVPA